MMSPAEFRRRVWLAAIAALSLPPSIGVLVTTFVGAYPFPEIVYIFFQYTGIYLLVCVLFVVTLTRRFLANAAPLNGDVSLPNPAFLRRLPSYFFLLLLLYFAGGVLSANLSLAHFSGVQTDIDFYLRSYLSVIPAVLITATPIFFYLTDSFGLYFGPRGLMIIMVPAGLKLVVLALFTPVMIDTLLILYYYDRTGFFGFETLALWFLLLLIASGGAYLALASFRLSLAPFRALLSQADPRAEPDLTRFSPQSLDEYGMLTAAWRDHLTSLIESRRVLRLVTENIPVQMAYIDANLRYVYVNATYEKLFRRPREEIVGRTVRDFLGEHVFVEVEPFLTQVLGGEAVRFDLTMRHADGVERVLDVRYTPEFADGRVTGFFSLVEDISERKRLETELRDSRNFLAAVLDNAAALVVVLDREGRIRRFNRACEELSRYSFQELEGKFIWDKLLLPEEVPAVREVFRKLTVESFAGQFENYWVAKDGERRLIDWSNSVLLDDHGSAEYVISIGIDITEQSLVTEALRRSEETYARAEAIAHIGSWDWDIVGGGLRWTDEIYRIFGQSPRIFGATYEAFLEAVHPEDRQQVIDAVNASLADPAVPYLCDHRVKRPDGEIRYVREQGQIYRDDDGAPLRMIGTVHDETERYKAEEQIERLASIVRNSSDFVGVSTIEGEPLFLNEAGRRLVGIRDDQELAQALVLDFFLEQDRDWVATYIIPTVLEQGRWAGEVNFRHFQSGAAIPVWFDIFRIDDPATGMPINFATISRDVTERKRSELELQTYRDHLEQLVQARTQQLETTQQELLKRERLATLGQLTATVSHELRNPLGAIKPSLYLLRSYMPAEQPKVANALARIERNIGRCDHIIDELLDFTRTKSLVEGDIRLDRWLEELLDEQVIPEGLTVEREILLRDITITADPEKLRRAIINVYENACHALMDTNDYVDDAAHPLLQISLQRGVNGRVEIVLVDNGPGIDPDVLERIFEPLFSTKGFGVGLGLPIVKQIMELHDGGIEVATQRGKGTTFTLWIGANRERKES